MKKRWLLLPLVVSCAFADPQKIDLPAQPPEDTAAPASEQAAPPAPISNTVVDPKDKNWREYDNNIVKAHMRVNVAWTMMEIKETKKSGTASFTLSRMPLVTFVVVRDPLEGDFSEYLSSAALTPLYPTGYKKSAGGFAGKRAVIIRGKATDDRMEESY